MKNLREVPIQFDIRGGLDYTKVWEFAGGVGLKNTHDVARQNTLIKSNESGAIVMTTDLKGLIWNGYCGHWDGAFTVPAKSQKTVHVVVAVGKKAAAPRNPSGRFLEQRAVINRFNRFGIEVQRAGYFLNLSTLPADG